MLQERGDERSLPGLKLLAAPVDRRFHHRGSGNVLGRQVAERDLNTLRNPFDLGEDRVRQIVALCPQRLELLVNPSATIFGGVFPEDLVVFGKRSPALVDAPQEARAPTICHRDDTGLAVQEDPIFWDDLDLYAPAAQELVEAAVCVESACYSTHTQNIDLYEVLRVLLAPSSLYFLRRQGQ